MQTEAFVEIQDCPKCGTRCDRDAVDVGVSTIFGPWGCPRCGWSDHEEYDLSEGRDPVDEHGGAIDQFGGYYPPGSSMARAYRLARETEMQAHKSLADYSDDD